MSTPQREKDLIRLAATDSVKRVRIDVDSNSRPLFGPDRDAARARMEKALDKMILRTLEIVTDPTDNAVYLVKRKGV